MTALGGCKCKEHRASLNTIHSHWGTAPPLDPIWRNNSGLSHILEALFWGLQILDINLSVRPFSEDLPNLKSSWVTIPYAPYSGMKLRKWGIPPNQIRAGSLHESCHELRGIYLPCSVFGLQPHFPFADFPKNSGDMIPGIPLLPLSCELKSWAL